MPIDKSKYPPNWELIRARILQRANYACEECGAELNQPHPFTGKNTQLQIAHANHDAENWDVPDSDLLCLCQRCHLRHDRKHHVKNWKNTTRRKKKIYL